EEERGEDATAADPVPQDLRMIDCVSEKQEAQTPRDRRQTNEVRRAEITGRAEPTRQDDLGLERAGHEENPESRQDEGEAGSVPIRAHATAYHAAPPSTFAEMDRSPLPHLLFALPAAHPLLAPLPAHLSALLPSPRRAFHRVAGRRVTPCRISSFPSPFPEGTWCRHVGEPDLSRGPFCEESSDRDEPRLRGGVQDVSGPAIIRAFAPGDVHVALRVERHGNVIAVREGAALCGHVRVAASESGDLHLGGPSLATIRGAAIPDIVRAGAVVHPRNPDIARIPGLYPREDVERTRAVDIEHGARGPS